MHNLEKKIIVIFGAGKSGHAFIENNKNLNIISIADNDREKWGKKIGHIEIIPPDSLKSIDHDAIIITSVYSDSIIHQLNEMGLESKPKIIPSKREMKGMRDTFPFSHEETKKIAIEATLSINMLMRSNAVDLYLDFGTLLGAIREKDFIAWDDDIDFSIHDVDFEKAKKIIQSNKNSLPKRKKIQWNYELLSNHDHDFCITLTCQNTENEKKIIPFEIGIARRVYENGSAVILGGVPEFSCPERFFNGFDTIELFGDVFKAPKNTEKYLNFLYGNWKTPQKDITLDEYGGANKSKPYNKIKTNSL